MSPQTNTEEIIEKKATAPVATSCLIIAAVALLCAIALQVTEIAEYRSGLASTSKAPGLDQATKDARKYKEEVGDILSKAPKIEDSAAAPKAGAGAAAPADTDSEDAGAAESKAAPADTKEAAEATDEADTKAEPADTKEAAETKEEAAPEADAGAEEEKAGE